MEMLLYEEILVGNFSSFGTRDDEAAAEAVMTDGQCNAVHGLRLYSSLLKYSWVAWGKSLNSFKLQLFKLQQGFSTVVLSAC